MPKNDKKNSRKTDKKTRPGEKNKLFLRPHRKVIPRAKRVINGLLGRQEYSARRCSFSSRCSQRSENVDTVFAYVTAFESDVMVTASTDGTDVLLRSSVFH